MRKNNFEDHSVSESGHWNMAESITEDLFYKLKRFDEYRNIAQVGYSSLIDHLMQVDYPLDYDRLEALKNMSLLLTNLINDSLSLLKDKDKEKAKDLKAKIKILKEFVERTEDNRVHRKSRSEVSHTSKIVLLDGFYKVLEELCEAKSELLSLFYKNDLIFPVKTQFDARSFKESTKKRIVEQG